jgi:hypothetical protein
MIAVDKRPPSSSENRFDVFIPKAVIACLLVMATFAPTALAHPADKVVQAAYLTLAPGGLRLELDLTPGELVANQFLGFLDQNTDGQIGDGEISVFAERVIQDLSVRVNGQVAALHLESKTVPDPAGLRTGGQQVTLIFAASLPDVTGENNLEFRNTLEFQNNFAPIRNAYLANVFVQSGEVKVLEQKRDATQQDFRVRYNLEPRAPRIDWVWFPAILVPSALIALWLTRTKRRTHEIAPH